MVNRGAIVLRPLQPFIDWAASLDDSGLTPSVEGEQAVYLVQEWEDDAEADRVLRRVFAELFERELQSWHTDERDWPQRRTFATFKKWFSVEMHSLVEDACDDPLLHEEV